MAADYLISSLQPLDLDGPAPYSSARFAEMCRDQLSSTAADAIAAIGSGASADGWAPAAQWADLATQLRNAIAAERARARGVDPAKWRHPVTGCSLYWANRVANAFQETDTAKRDRLLDQVWWDAAGELTPATAPLSAAAALTYAIRLGLVIRRRAISSDAGNAAFDALTTATKIDFKTLKEKQ